MGNFFQKDSIDETENEISIKDKIYKNTSFMDRIDFNINLLNDYIIKAINSFLKGKYFQDINICKKYLSNSCIETLKKDIQEEKQYYLFKDPIINIVNINIIDQNIKSVNFVSDIILEIEVSITYKKENIYTNILSLIIEEYKQNLWFTLSEKGWILEKYFERNFKTNESKIIEVG